MLFLKLRGKHIDLSFDLCDCPRIFFTHFRESKTNCLISHLSVMSEQCMNVRLEAHSLINQICLLGFFIDRMNSSASLCRIACCAIVIHIPSFSGWREYCTVLGIKSGGSSFGRGNVWVHVLSWVQLDISDASSKIIRVLRCSCFSIFSMLNMTSTGKTLLANKSRLKFFCFEAFTLYIFSFW